LDVLTRIKRGHVRIGVNLKGTSEDFSLKGDNISAQGFNPELYTQVDGAEHFGGMKIRCGLVAQ
jgi:hypothetical protein